MSRCRRVRADGCFGLDGMRGERPEGEVDREDRLDRGKFVDVESRPRGRRPNGDDGIDEDCT